ncbi:MAG: MarR family transcriptional regulator [Chitinophagaceae bacterium]|nr:MarR family transcriptional regulator [Chitinophagaceae bacterium]
MALEKDIHQSKEFRNERHKALVNLIYSFNWVKNNLQTIFEREGISMQQYNILRILNGSDIPISTLDIRERMLDKMSDTSRIVDRMVLKKLVKKKLSKIDKRLVDITITPKGKALLAKLDAYNHEIDGIISSLTLNEAAVLSNLLDKMRG